MNFITKNLKKVGIVNTILIAVCLILDGYVIGQEPYLLSIPSYVAANGLKIVSIVCGLVYAISGYKKNAAKYYKGFMILQLVTRIVDTFIDLYSTITYADKYGSSYYTTVFKFIIVICIAILAFAKDFGKKKSLIAAYTLLICDVAVFIRMITTYNNDIVLAFTYLLLGIITVIFVEAKYIDKEARGTK